MKHPTMYGKAVPKVRPNGVPVGCGDLSVQRASALHPTLESLSFETINHWVPSKGHKPTGVS